MLFIGFSGFTGQFLLTTALAHRRSPRVLALAYTQMLFALVLDRVVFGAVPGVWSLAGSALILGSCIWAAFAKEPDAEPVRDTGRPAYASTSGRPENGEPDPARELVEDPDDDAQAERMRLMTDREDVNR